MRLSQMLFVTLREDPDEAEIPSHKLLLRAGYIHRIGNGIYAYLPLMLRVLQKISQIVRDEMNATGAQECLLPQLQPAELWQQSGRWNTYTQAEGIMFALNDRHERALGLGPTNEEAITTIASNVIGSYQQLPLNLYQIQTKFRDEIRPRFGLIRGREFIMKDAYSFHADEESLKRTYQDMHQAYSKILRRLGLAFRTVEADTGAIGGSGSEEFMVLAPVGEDEILYTKDGQYAANAEKAISLAWPAKPSPFTTYEKRETPETETIEKLCQLLKCNSTQVVKNIIYQAVYDNGITVLVLVSIRGDQEVNEVKLYNNLVQMADWYGAKNILSLKAPGPDSQKQWATKPLPWGYIAPDLPDAYIKSTENLTRKSLKKFGLSDRLVATLVRGLKSTPGKGVIKIYASSDVKASITKNLAKSNMEPRTRANLRRVLALLENDTVSSKFLRLIDKTAIDLRNFVTGSNQIGYHVVGANWGEQFPLPAQVVDVRKAKAGDASVHNPKQTLQSDRGIEVGHIFQLGTKYSQAIGATYTNKQGEQVPLVMGCYGIGVSRLAQATVEQSYDKDGIIWPIAIAPYHAIITVPNITDSQQRDVAEHLYNQLNQAGIETLLDDRDERAGVKFNEADLMGIPYRIVTGKLLQAGKVEVIERATQKSEEIPVNEVPSALKQRIAAGLS